MAAHVRTSGGGRRPSRAAGGAVLADLDPEVPREVRAVGAVIGPVGRGLGARKEHDGVHHRWALPGRAAPTPRRPRWCGAGPTCSPSPESATPLGGWNESPPDESGGGDDDDHQRARPVHALDPVELDVAGRRRPADEGRRPGRRPARASISGTLCTTWSARTTQTWTSGTRVIARRPWSAAPSSDDGAGLGARRRVQAVTTAAKPSRSAARQRAVVGAAVPAPMPPAGPGAASDRPPSPVAADSASATVAAQAGLDAAAHRRLVVDQPVLEQVDDGGRPGGVLAGRR